MERSSIRISRKDLERATLLYMEGLDCPRSLAIWLSFKYEQANLLEFKCDPSHYRSCDDFRRAYLATKFLSKYDRLDVSLDRKKAAYAAFDQFEERCKVTNRRLKTTIPTGRVAEILYRARVKIVDLLPPVTSELIDNIVDSARFGPGVTSSVKGDFLSAYNKFGGRPECTHSLHSLVPALLGAGTSWADAGSPVAVQGNTVTVVPKNSKTDRTIAVEPHINAFLQRGVGRILARRLRRWGVTLNDQQPNQYLAAMGSRSGSHATLDLEGASDTVSIETVRLLFPSDWVALLENLRSPFYKGADGQWKRYHKHSSMGNGYTFELESMIFASIVDACCQLESHDYYEPWCVYGDDIVIPTYAASLCQEVLEFLGFSLNQSKSFTSGPFRESCGADFYDGEPCTPFVFRMEELLPRALTFANWLRSECPVSLRHNKLKTLWHHLYSSTPKVFRNLGPATAHTTFWVNEWDWDPDHVLVRRPYGPWIGYRVLVPEFLPLSRPVPLDRSGSLAGALFVLKNRGFASSPMDDAFCLPEPIDSARGRGRWVRRPLVFDQWPVVRAL